MRKFSIFNFSAKSGSAFGGKSSIISSPGFTPHYFLVSKAEMAFVPKLLNLNSGQKNRKNSAGFTLIELLVVLAIMGLLAGAIVANFAAQRDPRNLRIAENELVTNLRQIQSYTLSSQDITGGTPVQFYIIKIDTTKPAQYTIEAIYNANSSPAEVQDVQTIHLPPNIRFAPSSPITINGSAISSGCALISYKLPFGKVIMNDGCQLPSAPNVSPNDSYDHLISFVSNSAGGVTSSDLPMVIKLTNQIGTLSKTVTVSGITGGVTFQ